MKIILASTSKYRKSLLEKLFLEFTQIAPNIDENEYKKLNLSPIQLATKLSEAKTQKILNLNSDALVIGGDQVCALGDQIFDKPDTKENAITQLSQMQGLTHELITAITIGYQGKLETIIDITKLKMKHLTNEQIVKYLETDQPYDCAGSYKIESYGISLFDTIETKDHSAITGVPLLGLSNVLKKYGVITP